ncbi:MAG: Verru_Chthon cassette protein B [Candidatus Methylacidiphilales bacterium]|nr:Verru_Chthon cassette protein B [Candidatus Methylacidiphilales bacterium]
MAKSQKKSSERVLLFLGFQRNSRGFSLVEVTMALALVSFAGVVALGLLPTGLTTLRDSMNQTVEAQILQSIASQAVISKFDQLAANNLYFDDEGLPVTSASGAFFTVNMTTDQATFPGSANAVDLAQSLVNLKITIQSRKSPSAPSSTAKTKIYSLQVANSGK